MKVCDRCLRDEKQLRAEHQSVQTYLAKLTQQRWSDTPAKEDWRRPVELCDDCMDHLRREMEKLIKEQTGVAHG